MTRRVQACFSARSSLPSRIDKMVAFRTKAPKTSRYARFADSHTLPPPGRRRQVSAGYWFPRSGNSKTQGLHCYICKNSKHLQTNFKPQTHLKPKPFLSESLTESLHGLGPLVSNAGHSQCTKAPCPAHAGPMKARRQWGFGELRLYQSELRLRHLRHASPVPIIMQASG